MITSLTNLILKDTFSYMYKIGENATAFQFQINLFVYWTEQAENTVSLSTEHTRDYYREVKPESFTFGGMSNMLALKFAALNFFFFFFWLKRK